MDADDIALKPDDRAAAESGTWKLELPAISEHCFSKVEDLQHVKTGDKYLRPPESFPAIDSIAMIGDTAYLVQITQDLKHGINIGLLSVLACLPPHLDVRFLWALPDELWAQDTFNARDVPRIADLSSPTGSSRAGSKRRVETDKVSMPVTGESEQRGIAAARRVSRVNEAIRELVGRDVALVERRVAACKKQYKIAIPLTRRPPQASLSIASSLARSTASAAWGSCPVCAPPVTCLLNLVTAAFLSATTRMCPISELLLREDCIGASLCNWRNPHHGYKMCTLRRGCWLSDSCQLGHCKGLRYLQQRPFLPVTLCSGLSSRWRTPSSANHLALAACPGMPEDASAEEG